MERAGYFGKLPAFSDFIRHNASGPEIAALDQWLQEGLAAAKNRLAQSWDAAYRQASPFRFLFYPENAAQVLAGVLQKSHDQSERKFPFLVSIRIKRVDFPNADFALAPLLFESFYHEAEKLMAAAKDRETLSPIESISLQPSGWPATVSTIIKKFATMTNDHLLTEAFGRFDDPRKFLLYKNLGEILLPWRGKAPLRLSLGLRFPLGAETALSASFWLQTCGRLLQNPALALNYFWTAAGENQPAYLFVFFRRPPASALAQLLQPDLPNDNICALEAEGQDQLTPAGDNLPKTWRALLENKTLTLQDFLQRL